MAIRNRVIISFTGAGLLLGLCFAVIVAQQPPTDVEQLVKGPIIQDVQVDRATIAWVTQRGSVTLKKATAQDFILSDTPVFHTMQLDKLEAGTRYDYRLGRFGENVKGSFVTAPSDRNASFMFVVFGDTRTRHEVHTKSAEKVLAERPAFVLHTGDLVANGRDASQWDTFFDIEKELLRNAPFYPVPGNHENNSPLYFKYFVFPGTSGHYYSFDWGGAHIVALDTNEFGDTAEAKAAFVQEQVEWLKEDLEENSRSLTFVFFHHPLYTAVERRRSSAAKLAAVYEPVLERAGVTVVFNGHDHNYQHHLSKGVHHVVTGGGGAPLYDVVPIEGITIKTAKIENYVRVKVDGNKACLEAFDLEGNLIEAFEVTGKQ